MKATHFKTRHANLNNLLHIALEALSAKSVLVYKYHSEQDLFYLEEGCVKKNIALNYSYQLNRGVFKVAKSIHNPSIINQSRLLDEFDIYCDDKKIDQVCIFPIIKNKEFWGVCCIDMGLRKELNEKIESFLKLIHVQIINELHALDERKKFKDFKNHLSLYLEAGQKLNRSFRSEEVIETIYRYCKIISDLDTVVIVDINDDKTCDIKKASNPKLMGLSFELDSQKNLMSWVIDNQTQLFFEHYKASKAQNTIFPYELDKNYKTICIIPLSIQKKTIGGVFLGSEKENALSEERRHMLEAFCQHVSVSMSNAKTVDQLEHMATTDALTQILNHKSFQETLCTELAKHIRYQASLSLLLIDIDHFKLFNDQFGHQTGDKVLRWVASKLKSFIRNIDYVFRYGGEEFAILLTHTDPSGAMKLANRIVEGVAEAVCEFEKQKHQVTVSIGISSCPKTSVKQNELIKCADLALYEAKNNGRNQAKIYSNKKENIEVTKKIIENDFFSVSQS